MCYHMFKHNVKQYSLHIVLQKLQLKIAHKTHRKLQHGFIQIMPHKTLISVWHFRFID